MECDRPDLSSLIGESNELSRSSTNPTRAVFGGTCAPIVFSFAFNARVPLASTCLETRFKKILKNARTHTDTHKAQEVRGGGGGGGGGGGTGLFGVVVKHQTTFRVLTTEFVWLFKGWLFRGWLFRVWYTSCV
jgi:hypothetical protein